MLHRHIFGKSISEDTFNDYDSPLTFLDSIRAEHERLAESEVFHESHTARLIWEALYDALGTLRVERVA